MGDAENHLKSIDNGTNGTFTHNAYGRPMYNSSRSLQLLVWPLRASFFGGSWAGGAVHQSVLLSGVETGDGYVSGGTEYLWDLAGQDLGHYDPVNLNWAQAYVQFGGRMLSYYNQPGNYTRFFHANALGSERRDS